MLCLCYMFRSRAHNLAIVFVDASFLAKLARKLYEKGMLDYFEIFYLPGVHYFSTKTSKFSFRFDMRVFVLVI